MLKSVIICTAIAAFASIPLAHAQGRLGPSDTGRCFGNYNCMLNHNELDSPNPYSNADRIPGDSYQPYPSVSPSYGSTYGSDPYRSRSPYSSPYSHSRYGDDD
jgi:hypothetical protein